MLNACIPPHHHRAEPKAQVALPSDLLALPSDLLADVVILATPRVCVLTACRDLSAPLSAKRAKLAWTNAQCAIHTPPESVRLYQHACTLSVRTNLVAHLEQCCISRHAPTADVRDQLASTWQQWRAAANSDYIPVLAMTALFALLDSVPAAFLTPTRRNVTGTLKYRQQIHAAMDREVRIASASATAPKDSTKTNVPPLFTSVPLVAIVQFLVYVTFHCDAYVLQIVVAQAASRASAFLCVALSVSTWSRSTVKSIDQQWEREMQRCPHFDRPVRFTAYLGLAALSRWDADKFALVTEGELSVDKGELVDLLRQDTFITLALADLAHLDHVPVGNVIRILDWLIVHTASEAGGGPRRAIGGIPIHVFFIAPRLRPVFDHVQRHPLLLRPAEQ
ncbi:hypothetical protein H9P43_007194 [Blastocladiella emersonii ATCC 22665]|nr:hypothetical protein H9P43_007194 [Blastocladiella emersonii ATCC 22665]